MKTTFVFFLFLLGTLTCQAASQLPSTSFTRDFLRSTSAADARSKLSLVTSNWAFNSGQLESPSDVLQIKAGATVTNPVVRGLTITGGCFTNNGIAFIVTNAIPTEPAANGSLAVNTATGALYVRTNGNWTGIGLAGVSGFSVDATNANNFITANGNPSLAYAQSMTNSGNWIPLGFAQITDGTLTSVALLMGNDSSLGPTGTGVIKANVLVLGTPVTNLVLWGTTATHGTKNHDGTDNFQGAVRMWTGSLVGTNALFYTNTDGGSALRTYGPIQVYNFFTTPTNTPVDGYMIVATGTGGDTKYVEVPSGTFSVDATNGNNFITANGNVPKTGAGTNDTSLGSPTVWVGTNKFGNVSSTFNGITAQDGALTVSGSGPTSVSNLFVGIYGGGLEIGANSTNRDAKTAYQVYRVLDTNGKIGPTLLPTNSLDATAFAWINSKGTGTGSSNITDSAYIAVIRNATIQTNLVVTNSITVGDGSGDMGAWTNGGIWIPNTLQVDGTATFGTVESTTMTADSISFTNRSGANSNQVAVLDVNTNLVHSTTLYQPTNAAAAGKTLQATSATTAKWDDAPSGAAYYGPLFTNLTIKGGQNWLTGTNYIGGGSGVNGNSDLSPTNAAIVVTDKLQFRNIGTGNNPYGTNIFYIDPATGALLASQDNVFNIGDDGARFRTINVGYRVLAGLSSVTSSGLGLPAGGLVSWSGRSSIYSKANGSLLVTDSTENRDRFLIHGDSKVLTQATATGLFYVSTVGGASGTNCWVGGTIDYSIFCTDNSNSQVLSGVVTYAGVNPGGTWTSSITEVAANQAKAVSSGTLTATWTMTPRTSYESTNIVINVSADTSLTPAANKFYIHWQLRNNGTNSITVQ